MNTLPIEDLCNTYLEHSIVIHNFVIKVGSQIHDSLCRVFGGTVQYEWRENDDKVIVPDVSIICNMRDRKNISFTGIPRFVMEVLSPSTEKYDRTGKKDIYCNEEIPEYWIIDPKKRVIEVYDLDYVDDKPQYFLVDTITEKNKDDLNLIHFPHIKIDFDILFSGIE